MNLSDHKLLRVRFCIRDALPKRGRGYFKMNTLLLSEEGVDDFVKSRIEEMWKMLTGEKWEFANISGT